MRKLLNGIGIGLFGLILLGFGMRIYLGLRAHNAFLGTNYRGVPVGTYSSLIVLVVTVLVCLVLVVQKIALALKRRGRS